MAHPLTQSDPLESLECSGFRVGASGELEREHDVFECRECRNEMERLEDEPYAFGPKSSSTILIEDRQILTGQQYLA